MNARALGPSRRRLLHAGALAVTATSASAVLTACSSQSETSDRYDTGFVEGAGVSTEIPEGERGEPLDFEAATYSGETFTLSAQRPNPVVLNVWYAACAPCRKEAPDLRDIAREYEDQGVQFIGVNVRDLAGPAQAFEDTFEIPYPSVPDTEGRIMYALRGQVVPNAVPSTLIFDTQGRVAGRISGLADPSIVRAMIDRVLAE